MDNKVARFIVRSDVPERTSDGRPWFSLVNRRPNSLRGKGEGDEFEEYRVVHPNSLKDLIEYATDILGKDVKIVIYRE